MKLLGLFILIPLFFRNGTALNECDRCKCCKGGSPRCQYYGSTSDACLDGCIDGYYGNRCVHACMNNCLTCSNSQSCTKCSDGYYGTYCYTCPDNCRNCSSFGTCDSCKDGFYNGRLYDSTAYPYNSDCRLECQANCTSCTSYHECTECKEGFYNGKQYTNSTVEYFNCRHNCQSNCKECTSYYNCVACVPGKYNIIYSNCSENCNPNCKECTSKNTCTACVDGRYNNMYKNCSEKCSSNCKACTSETDCSSCQSGKYGLSCQYDCGIGCKSNECDINNGSCTCTENFQGDKCDQCVNGQYGNSCDIPCPSYCANNSCNIYDSCNSCKTGFTGNMCDECVSGRYGSSCNITCPTNCANDSCESNGDCNGCKTRFAGNMCDECVPGKYGSSCNITCPTNCAKSSCESNGDCNGCKTGFTGNMCDECVPGKYGSSCNITCPTNCANNSCERNGDCNGCKTGFAGNMCDECVPGKYGSSCNITCPTNCANSSCESNGDCNGCKTGFTGNMCDECVPGKYGSSCNITCPTNCANSSCESNGDCNGCKTGFTGNMCDECVPGKYGSSCNITCPTNCANSSCESNGDCNGCKTGFTGNMCDECVPGKYGNNCNMSCPLGCANNTCNISGDCYTCKSGFSGDTCHKCVSGKYGTECNMPCPLGCAKNVCNITGDCSTCKNGFTGDRCDECAPDKYGSQCDRLCPSNCGNSSCKSNGDCYSCVSGYSGNVCSQLGNAGTQTGTDGDNMGVTIGAAAGGGLFVVIIIVVVAVVIVHRKRSKRGKSEENDSADKNDITDHTTVKYSEVLTTGIAVEIADADPVYAMPNKPKKKVKEAASSNENISSKTVCNTNYETASTQNDIIVKTHTDIKLQAASDFENDVISGPVVRFSSSKMSAGQLDECAVELEEDIDNIVTSDNHRSVEAHATESEVADTYYNVTAVKRRKVKLDQLSDFVSEKTEEDFAEEFQQLPPGLIKPYEESQKKENLSKNRYRGIYPYDKTRVVLKDCGSDYINASYIDGHNKRKAYIASIGPTYKYMGDMSAFWIMVWQEKVGKIVMLTKLDEGGLPKCDQYWPEKDFSLMYANIQVTCQNEETYADYTVRSFTVQRDSEKRSISQVHFMAWPDKGTPDDVTSLIEFRQKVISIKTELEGPILVHCSAGIGRTGTYIALDSLTEEGEAEGGVDIFAFVRNMREQRVNMVQTSEQYQYVHRALVHTLTFDSKAVEASKFGEYMTVHTDGHFVESFQKLQASGEQRSDDEKEAVKRNQALENKNRVGADIPGDRNRPRLYLDRKLGEIDYINAVYVNSYQTINRYLVAQTPIPDTVVDFLTLIVQERVSCIVSMETVSDDDKTVGTYFADNKPVKIGAFTVKSEQMKGTDQYALQTLCISHKGNSGTEEVTIPHIQFTQWNDNKSIPEEPAKFVKFVKEVELKYVGNEAKGPILIHCLTGAEKSGLFCVVSTLLEKTEIDHEISVVNTVRQIKHRRHMSIPNKEQYIFCHRCVNEYLQTFDSYSNFGFKT